MSKITGLNFLLGILLTGSPVVADDVNLAPGQLTNADLIRRVSHNTSTPASATESASAATVAATPSPPEQMNEEKNNLRVATGASPSLSGDEASPLHSSTNALPPLPPGVGELRFSEFFRSPIGPHGLEYTEKLRRLNGRRIRILGYMVRQEQPVDHGFLLAPVPLTLHESG